MTNELRRVKRAGDAWETVSESETPGGGSQPGAVRRLDLGVVTLADVGTTLYTPAAGEIVGPITLRDVVYTTDGGAFISLLIVGTDEPVNLAGWDSDLARDGAGYAAIPVVGDFNVAPTTIGPVVVDIGVTGAGALPFAHATWVANTAFGLGEFIIAVGHVWQQTDDPGGDSGNVEPDFAGNIGGSVVDNDLTWTDEGVLGDGAAHVYADVCVPVAP